MQAFSRSQAGIDNRNINLLLQSLRMDHLRSQVYNTYRFPHVEQIDIAGLGQRRGEDNHATGFGTGHKVARSPGIGYGNGPTLLNLTYKSRDYAATGTENVA